ncbi:hypothetical protein DYB32_006759 [Aphanomyces invadans]|uniref:Uncharacterized protein n=1 Tax=Aphanomyces invadans TaxID=157072 RepID=A0A418AQR7_9STRA|nr:hypothetical protein DYB32_006759 [Aphanomyces invadans]
MQVEVPDDAVPQVEQSPMAASAYSQLDEESLANDREEQLHESIQYPWYWRCFHFTDSTAIVLDTDGPKPRRPRSQMNVLDHPVVVSLILQFPWIGLSLLYFSVFELMTSYLTSIGVHYFVPRYMPAFLTFALAPLVGAASDRCSSKTGRRNRFVFLRAMAWFSLDNQKYKWWAERVFRGCPQLQGNATTPDGAVIAGCDATGVKLYMEGLDMARHAVQGLVGSLHGGPGHCFSHFTQSADFMDATDRFNNNGLYVGLLMQFSCCAKFAVENYNTTAISSLGTTSFEPSRVFSCLAGSDDVLALPLLLFVASTVFTFFYKYDV